MKQQTFSKWKNSCRLLRGYYIQFFLCEICNLTNIPWKVRELKYPFDGCQSWFVISCPYGHGSWNNSQLFIIDFLSHLRRMCELKSLIHQWWDNIQYSHPTMDVWVEMLVRISLDTLAPHKGAWVEICSMTLVMNIVPHWGRELKSLILDL